jgi:hypothetical protein
MKETSHQPVSLIQIPQGPATETRDGKNPFLLLGKGKRVLPEHSFDRVLVLNVLITWRTDRRAAGKTALFSIRKT